MSGISPGIQKAFLVPGLAHLSANEGPAKHAWEEMKAAYQKAGEAARAAKPDVLVIYSAQWISVLGHSFQADPNPKGLHVDDNWYYLDGLVSDFPFSFTGDTELAKAAEANTKAKGLATKLVNYEGFPIDTGTLVALKYFNPDNKIPVLIVSSNIYCGQKDSELLGQAVAEAVQKSGKKAVFITISSLSNRFFTHDIKPEEDRISSASDDEWNRKILALIEAGKNKEAVALGADYAKAANPEMQFKGFYWLMGALGTPDTPGKVHHYGPVWGTGNAVVEYSLN